MAERGDSFRGSLRCSSDWGRIGGRFAHRSGCQGAIEGEMGAANPTQPRRPARKCTAGASPEPRNEESRDAAPDEAPRTRATTNGWVHETRPPPGPWRERGTRRSKEVPAVPRSLRGHCDGCQRKYRCLPMGFAWKPLRDPQRSALRRASIRFIERKRSMSHSVLPLRLRLPLPRLPARDRGRGLPRNAAQPLAGRSPTAAGTCGPGCASRGGGGLLLLEGREALAPEPLRGGDDDSLSALSGGSRSR